MLNKEVKTLALEFVDDDDDFTDGEFIQYSWKQPQECCSKDLFH